MFLFTNLEYFKDLMKQGKIPPPQVFTVDKDKLPRLKAKAPKLNITIEKRYIVEESNPKSNYLKVRMGDYLNE